MFFPKYPMPWRDSSPGILVPRSFFKIKKNIFVFKTRHATRGVVTRDRRIDSWIISESIREISGKNYYYY
jgi:hypothetical protein